MRLFNWFILRRLLREPLRSATTVLGIALGVAVIVAIQLTNASSVAGFATALDTVSGRTSLEIFSPGGRVDELRLPELGWLRDFGAVTPVIEGAVILLREGRPAGLLRVIGVDILRDSPFRDYRLLEGSDAGDMPSRRDFLELLRDPTSAILAAKFASPLGLAVGSSFEVQSGDRAVRLSVRGLLKDEGPARLLDGRMVLMDLGAAQETLDRLGWVDRVELQVADPAAIDSAETAIAARLPAGLSVQRPAQRGREVEHMLAAFHLNLTALSFIALIVGLFLVYNTVSVSVLSRREEIGMLRAVGVTRRQVRSLFLAEAAGLSIVGSALGIGVGRLLADATVALTSTTVSALYIATAAAPPALDWRQVLLAFGTGVPLSLLAALVPAREAASVTPLAAIRGADALETRTRRPRRHLLVAIGLLVLGGWLATLDAVGGLPLYGYASAMAIVFGASFLVPSVLAVIVGALERPVRRLLRIEDWLAVNNLAAAVPRLSISVAALAVSLSMMTAIAIMIGSFRDTVIYWVDQSLRADLYISPGTSDGREQSGTLSAATVRAIAAAPAVAALDEMRVTDVPFRDTRVRVVARDFGVVAARGGLLFKAPADGVSAMIATRGQDVVLASEAFTIKHGFALGDVVPVPTPSGVVPCRIAAIYFDYSSDRGVLVMDRATFARAFGERPPSGVSAYVQAGIDADAARDQVLAAVGGDHGVFINTNRSLRAEVLRIFDSTFAITYALELVAIVVAILGVSGTLLTLVLERAREFRILRLVGTDRRQIRRMVMGEALVIGAISQAVGLVVGLALSLVLIYVVNVQSFGWTIQFHLPVAFLVQSSIVMIVATSLAGLYPARRAAALTMRQEE